MPRHAFDFGCSNGVTAGMLAGLAFDVVGVDPSESSIHLAELPLWRRQRLR